MGRRLEAVPTRLQGRPWAGSFSVTWGEDGGRGLGAGQMLGVHDERTEQRGEKRQPLEVGAPQVPSSLARCCLVSVYISCLQVATLESIQKGNLVSQPAQEVFLQASQLF